MKIAVTSENGQIVFEFAKPSRFDVFVVSSSSRQVMWELKPAYMHQVPVARATLIGVSVPRPLQNAVQRPMRASAADPTAGEAEVPLLSRVVYGDVPTGYNELTAAQQLQPGNTYALLVFAADGDSGGAHFSP
jgi:hypothetical protein